MNCLPQRGDGGTECRHLRAKPHAYRIVNVLQKIFVTVLTKLPAYIYISVKGVGFAEVAIAQRADPATSGPFQMCQFGTR